MKARNKRTFTDEFLNSLSNAEIARAEYGDRETAGLLARANKSGTVSFSVIFRILGDGGVSDKGRLLRGKQQRITIDRYPEVSLDDARHEALLIRSKASKGIDPRQERRQKNLLRNANSVENVAKDFIEKHAKVNTVAWKNAESAFKNYVYPAFGKRPIEAITKSDIHKLMDDILSLGKQGTAREVKKHLSTLFNWAISREVCKHNPILNLGRKDLMPNPNAGRALEDDEIKAIWSATEKLGYPFGSLYQLLLLTGQRKSEWAKAKISEVNKEEHYLEVPKDRYKSRRDHIIPFSNEVKNLFNELPEWVCKDYYLFSTRGGKIPVSGYGPSKNRLDTYTLEKLCKIKNDQNYKLKPFRIHDFRVTCETRLANLGFNQEIRNRVLGHAFQGLQKTYNKYDYTEEKKEALNTYAKRLLRFYDRS